VRTERRKIHGSLVLGWLLLSLAILHLLFDPSSLIADDPAAGPASAEDWVYLRNDHLRVGLLRSHGGAIGHLSMAGDNTNWINHYDHGRLIQQSYYGDEDGSLWADRPWRYNPVQGGGYRGNAAEVVEFRSTESSAFTKTIPVHWATGAPLKECWMEQKVSLEGSLLRVDYAFTYSGERTHQARHQETPAVFVSPELKFLVTYDGENPWTGGELHRRVPGWPNESIKMTEHWVAYVGEDGRGVGVCIPVASEGTCYRYLGGHGSDCSYVAPLVTFSLTPNRRFTYTAYFTLGKVEEIRHRFSTIHDGSDPLTSPELPPESPR
jgi:hypothetical protein